MDLTDPFIGGIPPNILLLGYYVSQYAKPILATVLIIFLAWLATGILLLLLTGFNSAGLIYVEGLSIQDIENEAMRVFWNSAALGLLSGVVVIISSLLLSKRIKHRLVLSCLLGFCGAIPMLNMGLEAEDDIVNYKNIGGSKFEP